MTRLLVLCMNEIPIGVYTTDQRAMVAKVEHEKKEGIRFPYDVKEFVVDAAAKR